MNTRILYYRYLQERQVEQLPDEIHTWLYSNAEKSSQSEMAIGRICKWRQRTSQANPSLLQFFLIIFLAFIGTLLYSSTAQVVVMVLNAKFRIFALSLLGSIFALVGEDRIKRVTYSILREIAERGIYSIAITQLPEIAITQLSQHKYKAGSIQTEKEWAKLEAQPFGTEFSTTSHAIIVHKSGASQSETSLRAPDLSKLSVYPVSSLGLSSFTLSITAVHRLLNAVAKLNWLSTVSWSANLINSIFHRQASGLFNLPRDRDFLILLRRIELSM